MALPVAEREGAGEEVAVPGTVCLDTIPLHEKCTENAEVPPPVPVKCGEKSEKALSVAE